MIIIKKHDNFSNWFQVFSLSGLLNEFTKRADAVRYAREIAQKHNISKITINGGMLKIK
tara:strand:+ start:71 stop:247 length:177 start_codon:yes stop_codon:yes gene_type:complete